MRKTTWRTQSGHKDFEVEMRDDFQQKKTVTQLDPELEELDNRLTGLDGPDDETDQKELE